MERAPAERRGTILSFSGEDYHSSGLLNLLSNGAVTRLGLVASGTDVIGGPSLNRILNYSSPVGSTCAARLKERRRRVATPSFAGTDDRSLGLLNIVAKCRILNYISPVGSTLAARHLHIDEKGDFVFLWSRLPIHVLTGKMAAAPSESTVALPCGCQSDSLGTDVVREVYKTTTVHVSYSSVSDSPATMAPLNTSQKEQIARALNVMATRTIAFTWGANYTAAHNAKTSDLGGLKPGSRQDSAAPNLYWVAMFETSSKRIIPPPLIAASFQNVPDTATAVAGLRAALEAA